MTDIVTRLLTDCEIEIAKKLLKMGLTDAQIAEGTNLDVDTIEELRERYEQENQDNDD